jgi:hypothetical protein
VHLGKYHREVTERAKLMDKLDNLKLGRLPIYQGELQKIRTTLSLSESSRKYLSQYGNGMSETIEALVWLHSRGQSGCLSPKFEMWRDKKLD